MKKHKRDAAVVLSKLSVADFGELANAILDAWERSEPEVPVAWAYRLLVHHEAMLKERAFGSEDIAAHDILVTLGQHPEGGWVIRWHHRRSPDVYTIWYHDPDGLSGASRYIDTARASGNVILTPEEFDLSVKMVQYYQIGGGDK